jgi:hypothetical protein
LHGQVAGYKCQYLVKDLEEREGNLLTYPIKELERDLDEPIIDLELYSIEN